MKIIIVLVVLILLGIVVGSNLSPVMTVVIFNQPTIALPIGAWLLIVISAGFLSSCLIQFVIFIDRRLTKRQIRQLQTRLQQPDPDIFTYTSSGSASDSSSAQKHVRESAAIDQQTSQQQENPSAHKKGLFNSYRSKSVVKEATPPENRSAKSPTKSINDDSDDWDVEPVSNRQLEWEDSPIPPQQNRQTINYSSKIGGERADVDRSTQKIDSTPKQTRREVYDADFRLIQPPYKDPLETEFDDDRESADFEYSEIDEGRDFDVSSSMPKSPNTNYSTASKNSDNEDWGFDFEDRDPPVRSN
jgi:uncharacterized membrane protein YciS (DUF1049 family)